MKNYLFFIFLLALVACSSRKGAKNVNQEFKNEIKSKLIECISATEGVSEQLKQHIERMKSLDSRIPYNFNRVKLEKNDIEIIRKCKREVFQERRKKITIDN